jgi:hypothetical protein
MYEVRTLYTYVLIVKNTKGATKADNSKGKKNQSINQSDRPSLCGNEDELQYCLIRFLIHFSYCCVLRLFMCRGIALTPYSLLSWYVLDFVLLFLVALFWICIASTGTVSYVTIVQLLIF